MVLTICNQDGTPLTDELCDIWAFGFDRQIVFENGVIRTWSEAPLQSGHHMTIMVSLEKRLLSPLRTVEGSFEAVKELAFEDSDYESNPFLDILGTLLFLCLFLELVFLPDQIRKVRLKKRMKQTDYFRDTPNSGNLNVTHQLGLCSLLCEEDALLGAYLLRLISQGCLENIKSLTKKGQQELDELLGLKRFLLDFSLIQERCVKETILWQDYMVYALLFGIADKLAPQIRELYPESIPQLEQYQRYINYTNYYNGLMYGAYRRKQQRREVARSAGSGGRASFGGGRGSSGGGRGGSR